MTAQWVLKRAPARRELPRLAHSPSVPTASPPAAGGRTRDETHEPQHQNDKGDPPQDLECETGAEEKQREQQNDKQGNHAMHLR
ncbi:hypothetical protein GCM10010394_18790 [Streptomyces crystallinus]|uniref:Uncharacterized protein n=1 Tax=Streptomyces crystallinus TaxID=68191 RepID=A0ABP3QKX9_9ACTN